MYKLWHKGEGERERVHGNVVDVLSFAMNYLKRRQIRNRNIKISTGRGKRGSIQNQKKKIHWLWPKSMPEWRQHKREEKRTKWQTKHTTSNKKSSNDNGCQWSHGQYGNMVYRTNGATSISVFFSVVVVRNVRALPNIFCSSCLPFIGHISSWAMCAFSVSFSLSPLLLLCAPNRRLLYIILLVDTDGKIKLMHLFSFGNFDGILSFVSHPYSNEIIAGWCWWHNSGLWNNNNNNKILFLLAIYFCVSSINFARNEIFHYSTHTHRHTYRERERERENFPPLCQTNKFTVIRIDINMIDAELLTTTTSSSLLSPRLQLNKSNKVHVWTFARRKLAFGGW